MNAAKAIIVAGALIAAAVMLGPMSRPDARTSDEFVYLNSSNPTGLWVIHPATKKIHLCGAGRCVPAIHP